MNSMVGELSLYDVANTKGVAADVSHINTPAQVQVGSCQLQACVQRAVCSLLMVGSEICRALRAQSPWGTPSRAAMWSSSLLACLASPA
jgi:hypothetical protein